MRNKREGSTARAHILGRRVVGGPHAGEDNSQGQEQRRVVQAQDQAGAVAVQAGVHLGARKCGCIYLELAGRTPPDAAVFRNNDEG